MHNRTKELALGITRSLIQKSEATEKDRLWHLHMVHELGP